MFGLGDKDSTKLNVGLHLPKKHPLPKEIGYRKISASSVSKGTKTFKEFLNLLMKVFFNRYSILYGNDFFQIHQNLKYKYYEHLMLKLDR